MGSTLYFVADNGTSGFELWKSDGTDTGTVMTRDILPGWMSGVVPGSAMLGLSPEGVLLFTAADMAAGTELWRTDGTSAGTRLLADIAEGTASSVPESLVRAGPLVLLAPDDRKTGREPWALYVTDLADTTAPTVSCPANTKAAATSAQGAVVSYPPASASDTVSPVSLTYSQASGTLFPVGTTWVTVTALDRAGNGATCSFSITVTPLVPLAPATASPEAPVRDTPPAVEPADTGRTALGCASTSEGASWASALLLLGLLRMRRRGRIAPRRPGASSGTP